MIQASDLSLADIEFLQAVRDINNNPNKYPETDRTEVPANTAAIKKATELSADQVSYRMGGNANSRGLEEPSEPLIEPVDAVPTDRGYSPRAARLTSYGMDTLTDAQKIGSRLEGVSRADLDRINQRLEYLEIKSNIQDYLILFDYPDIRYLNSDDDIIGVTQNSLSATVSKATGSYEITVTDDGGIIDTQEVETPSEAANLLVNSVSQ